MNALKIQNKFIEKIANAGRITAFVVFGGVIAAGLMLPKRAEALSIGVPFCKTTTKTDESIEKVARVLIRTIPGMPQSFLKTVKITTESCWIIDPLTGREVDMGSRIIEQEEKTEPLEKSEKKRRNKW